MTRQRWLFASLAAILIAGPGCISYGHRGYHLARDVGAQCEVPACQRSHVYVFAVSSLNPVSVFALDGLAEALNRQGFPKVATGQTVHVTWMHDEMRRIHEQEPEAVFVVVGLESGTPAAVRLAEKAAASGLPVNGLVVIDSTGKAPPTTSIPTLVVGNVGELQSSGAVQTAAVPNVATYGLATDGRTVEAMARLLGETASSVPMPATVEVAEWEYPHAPPMRPEGDPSRAAEWSYLFDHVARANRPATPASPVTARSAVQPATATVRSAIR